MINTLLRGLSLPKFTLLKLMTESPTSIAVAVPVTVAITKIVDYNSVWCFLGWLFLADLITGLAASYFVWKESDHKDRWFLGKGEGFNSNKAKGFGVKLLIYFNVPMGAIQLQKMLMLKNVKFNSVSEAEFEMATCIVLAFCAIEIFSIFAENLPKIGFDIVGIIKKIKTVKDEIK